MQPIGHVRKPDDRTLIVLDESYQPGLLGLEGFSHIHVFWWFDRNDTPEKRQVLQVHPMGDPENPLTGVFATRSSARASGADRDERQSERRRGRRAAHHPPPPVDFPSLRYNGYFALCRRNLGSHPGCPGST